MAFDTGMLPKFNSMWMEWHIIEIPPLLGIKVTPFEDTPKSTATPGSKDMPPDPDFTRHNGTSESGLWPNLYRWDTTILGCKATGMGCEWQLLVKGAKHTYTRLKPRTGLAIWLSVYIDYQGNHPDETVRQFTEEQNFVPGALTTTCVFDAQVGVCFIDSEGGVTETTDDSGQSTLHINASTMHNELAKSKCALLSYLNRTQADEERALWANVLERTEESLGLSSIKGSGPLDSDPLQGVGTYENKFDALATGDLSPKPANELHIMYGLNVTLAFLEYIQNHVFVNRGDGLKPFDQSVICNIATEEDWEHHLQDFAIQPGSFCDAALGAAGQGQWMAYFDNLNRFHFEKDWCAKADISENEPLLIVVEGQSQLGTVKITPPPQGKLVNRVAIQSQWSVGDSSSGKTPQEYHKDSYSNMAIYPQGTRSHGGGEDVQIEGYLGKQVSLMAASEYARLQQRATVEITDFPWVHLALPLLNQLIGVNRRSPMGLYNWSSELGSETQDWQSWIRSDVPTSSAEPLNRPTWGPAGKFFKVTSVTLNNNNPDEVSGGDYTCTISGIEVFPLPGDATLAPAEQSGNRGTRTE